MPVIILIYISILLIIMYFDVKYYIIPDYIILPGLLFFLILSIISKLKLLNLFLNITLSGGFFLIISLLLRLILKKEVLGGGDIKLITLVGLYKGWNDTLFIILLSSLSALVCTIVLHFLKKRDMNALIPYGFYIGLTGILYEVYFLLNGV